MAATQSFSRSHTFLFATTNLEILGPAASDNEEDEIEEDANEEGDEDEDNALSTLKLLEDQSKAGAWPGHGGAMVVSIYRLLS